MPVSQHTDKNTRSDFLHQPLSMEHKERESLQKGEIRRRENGGVALRGFSRLLRLGDKRRAIEAFLAKDHGDFLGDATWDT